MAVGLAALVLAVALSAVLWLISARYAARFAGRERVAMNWSFNGKPNSFASPRTALSVTPAVGSVALLLIGGLVGFATPAEDQPVALAMIVFAGAVLAAVHAAHLEFAARAPDRKDG